MARLMRRWTTLIRRACDRKPWSPGPKGDRASPGVWSQGCQLMRECQPPLPLTEDAKCELGGGDIVRAREHRGGEFGRGGSRTIGGRSDTWLPWDPCSVPEKKLLLQIEKKTSFDMVLSWLLQRGCWKNEIKFLMSKSPQRWNFLAKMHGRWKRRLSCVQDINMWTVCKSVWNIVA